MCAQTPAFSGIATTAPGSSQSLISLGMHKLLVLLNSRYLLWLVLAVPGVLLIWPFLMTGFLPPNFRNESGEWAMRLLILTLALTPLQRIFRTSRLVHWFVRRHRYFGVASFLYAALHVGFYVLELIDAWGAAWLSRVLFVAGNLFAFAGWLAFALYLPLALSSNAFSQRRMGRWWKLLQRLTYFTALAAAVHWLMLANRPAIWVQLGLLVLLEAIRLGLWFRRYSATRQRF